MKNKIKNCILKMIEEDLKINILSVSKYCNCSRGFLYNNEDLKKIIKNLSKLYKKDIKKDNCNDLKKKIDELENILKNQSSIIAEYYLNK